MLAVDKAEVIQMCVNKILGNREESTPRERDLGIKKCIETLEQFKTEVDALAEQEAKQWAEAQKQDESLIGKRYLIVPDGKYDFVGTDTQFRERLKASGYTRPEGVTRIASYEDNSDKNPEAMKEFEDFKKIFENKDKESKEDYANEQRRETATERFNP